MPMAPGPRVLSIQQPWAWAVARGRKKIENRSWTTPHRGDVYIHASTKLDRDALKWLASTAGVRPPKEFTFSAIIAVATIADVVTGRDARKFKLWFFGPYGFVLKNIRSLRRPVRTKGRLGLFRASPSLTRAVKRQLR